MKKTGIGGIPLKATKYALDPNGVEHVFWDEKLPPGWHRKYVPARTWRDQTILPLILGITLLGGAFLFHGNTEKEGDTAYMVKKQEESAVPFGVDISQIYPFTEPETSSSVTEKEEENVHLTASLPTLPTIQPRPVLPSLPQSVRLPSEDKGDSKNNIRHEDERSPIAFIGGDGVRLMENSRNQGKEGAKNGQE